jgi:hypothetical protein
MFPTMPTDCVPRLIADELFRASIAGARLSTNRINYGFTALVNKSTRRHSCKSPRTKGMRGLWGHRPSLLLVRVKESDTQDRETWNCSNVGENVPTSTHIQIAPYASSWILSKIQLTWHSIPSSRRHDRPGVAKWLHYNPWPGCEYQNSIYLHSRTDDA